MKPRAMFVAPPEVEDEIRDAVNVCMSIIAGRINGNRNLRKIPNTYAAGVAATLSCLIASHISLESGAPPGEIMDQFINMMKTNLPEEMLLAQRRMSGPMPPVSTKPQ